MSIRFQAAAVLLLLCRPNAWSLNDVTLPAPGESHGFATVTSYADLQSYLARLDSLPSLQVAPLTVSREGRTVSLVRWPEQAERADTSRVTVLLFAQQHGDEPSGKEAITLLLAELSGGGKPEWSRHLNLLIVPQMNPDGAEAGQRRTSDSLDMNRSHVLLQPPEVRALHRLYLATLPEVTLDIHEYGSFSSSWSDSGFIKTGDVQIGTLTNLNSGSAIRSYQRIRMLPYLRAALMAQQYSCHEYIVGDPGTLIRHSTTEINDGRQSFGIRGSISFIQEGRKWRDLTDQLERRARSQYAALEALLDFCVSNRREIRRLVREERTRIDTIARTTLYTWMDHVPGSRSMTIPVMDVLSSTPTSWTITPYHGVVQGRDSVRLPDAYLVPGEYRQVQELLALHEIQGVPAGNVPVPAEQYEIVGFDSLVLESDPYRIPQVQVLTASLVPDSGAMIYPVNQQGGVFLATVLEPRSVWGLSKYAPFEALFAGKVYPVSRLMLPPAEPSDGGSRQRE